MARVVILVHGVHTSPARARGWMKQFKSQLLATVPDLSVEPFTYGYVLGAAITLPFIGGATRKHFTKQLQNFVAKVGKKNPDATIDIVAHSFGTLMTFNSMTQENAPKAFYRKIVLMGGIVSSREDFQGVRGHFSSLLNLWSKGDDVIRFAPFGHCGHKGFETVGLTNNGDKGLVENMDFTPCNHEDYTAPGKQWDAVINYLRT